MKLTTAQQVTYLRATIDSLLTDEQFTTLQANCPDLLKTLYAMEYGQDTEELPFHTGEFGKQYYANEVAQVAVYPVAIDNIKALRQRFQCTLKEAKDVHDAFRAL